MKSVGAVSAEDVQERARKDEEEGEDTKKVRPVLTPKQNCRHGGKGEKHKKRARPPEAPLRCGSVSIIILIVGVHDTPHSSFSNVSATAVVISEAPFRRHGIRRQHARFRP
jgi:hypothetical protein